jgi:hypothetical protein
MILTIFLTKKKFNNYFGHSLCFNLFPYDLSYVFIYIPRKDPLRYDLSRDITGCQPISVYIRRKRGCDINRHITVNCFNFRGKNEIIMEAKRRIGEKGYSIAKKKCQHFVSECRNGVSFSPEVEFIIECIIFVYYFIFYKI